MAFGKASGCVLMAVCLFAMADAFKSDDVVMLDRNDSPENDLEMAQLHEERAGVLPQKRMASSIYENDGFKCSGITCRYCRDVTIPYTLCAVTYCLSVTYLTRKGYGTMTVKVEAAGRAIFETDFQGLQPNKVTMCDKQSGVDICLELYDLYADPGAFSGCANVTVNNKMPFYKLECFRINAVDDHTHR